MCLTHPPPPPADPFEWRLTEMEDPRTRQRYLLDNETRVLYVSNVPMEWPQVRGPACRELW